MYDFFKNIKKEKDILESNRSDLSYAERFILDYLKRGDDYRTAIKKAREEIRFAQLRSGT